MESFVRIGVIGIGNMGSEHCRSLISGACPELRLTAVADLRESRRTWGRDTLPREVSIHESGSELIRAGECDAVLIAVPHYEHEALSVEAMENGLHVLCEKPIAVSCAHAEHMTETARRTGRTLALMFNQRTNCVYRAIREVLSSGKFGAMKRMNWIVTDWYRTQKYYDSGAWRATWAGEGGGVLLNQCPHQLDLLIWLCGMPENVTARCLEGHWHHIEVEDDVTAFLTFPGGATGVFVTSTGDLPGTNRLEIDCERGKIVCENQKVHCWELGVNEREVCFESENPWYRPEVKEYDLVTDGKNPQHVGVLNAFAAHLLRGEKLTASAEDGIRALALSNAIHLSSWTGTTVTLPGNEELFEKLLAERIRYSRIKTTEDLTFDTDHSGTGSVR